MEDQFWYNTLMVALLISVSVGVLFAIFATQNTGPISLNLGTYSLTNVPTYLAILIPLLIGLTLALLLHFMHDLSQKLTISEQRDEIKNLKKELAEVTKFAHKFQIENSKLKSENGIQPDPDSI